MDQESMDALHESLVAIAAGFNDLADTLDEILELIDRVEMIVTEGLENGS